jgi:hypothetical protein
MPKAIYRVEAVQEYELVTYVIAENEDAAREDGTVLSKETPRSEWDTPWGADISISKVDNPDSIPTSVSIWSGGPEGTDVSITRAKELLAESDSNERPPECPGQLSIEDVTP